MQCPGSPPNYRQAHGFPPVIARGQWQIAHAGTANGDIGHESARRDREDHQHGRRETALTDLFWRAGLACLLLCRGSQHAALDLKFCRAEILGSQTPGIQVTLQFLQLIAVNRQRFLAAFLLVIAVRSGRENRPEQQQDNAECQNPGKNPEDHQAFRSCSDNNASIRLRSSSVKGTGASLTPPPSRRRRRNTATPMAPRTPMANGPYQRNSVSTFTGGFSSTKSP